MPGLVARDHGAGRCRCRQYQSVGRREQRGLVDIRNLTLGGLNSFIVIEYEVRLAPVLPNNSYVANQAQVLSNNTEVARSDDPTVNAAPDPLVLGDEDPTRVQITSAPKFRVLKTAEYLGASPTRAAGRRAAALHDHDQEHRHRQRGRRRDSRSDSGEHDRTSPAARRSTARRCADDAQGLSPLVDGIAVYAPEDSTPGAHACGCHRHDEQRRDASRST